MASIRPDLDLAWRRLDGIFRPLAQGAHDSALLRHDQLTQASIADWKASAEDRQRRLRAAAQLRFDHAREINDVARSMPHFID